MGLDMYAWAVPQDVAKDNQVNITLPEGIGSRKIEYWRKFNNLHGWMEKLYRSKGGEGDFNCDSVRLMEEDLDQLLKDVNNLEPTSGFFFGGQRDMTDEDIKAVVDFVTMARAAIKNGEAVYYSSWW